MFLEMGMIVSLEIPASTRRQIARDQRAAARASEVFGQALLAGAVVGAERIREQLVMGELGLTMRHPASGLAASLMGWMVDAQKPEAAIGVPANSPAAKYAGILERGGTIVPKNARALAIPVSEEAKQYSSPRDMPDLTLIPRKGKPPLLVRELMRRGDVRGFELHWVLVSSVTIESRHWLTKGAEAATPDIADAAGDVIHEWIGEW